MASLSFCLNIAHCEAQRSGWALLADYHIRLAAFSGRQRLMPDTIAAIISWSAQGPLRVPEQTSI
jgi:hypothetical protein